MNSCTRFQIPIFLAVNETKLKKKYTYHISKNNPEAVIIQIIK